jgi:hypothetical protein
MPAGPFHGFFLMSEGTPNPWTSRIAQKRKKRQPRPRAIEASLHTLPEPDEARAWLARVLAPPATDERYCR